MSHRFLVFIIIFLSQSVFAVGQVDNVYYERSEVCSLSYQSFCKSDVYPRSTANEVITPAGCGFYGYSDPQAHYQTQYRQWWDLPPEGAISYSNAGLAATRHKICNVGETLKLDGCTASCEADPCAGKKGAKFTSFVTCGTASCDSPAVLMGVGSFDCVDPSSGLTAYVKHSFSGYAGSAVKDSCIGSINPEFNQPATPEFYSRIVAAGSSSAAAFCEAEYVYTGTSASPDDPPSDLISVSGVGVLASTENGSCPSNYIHGEGPSGWICVPSNFGGAGTGGASDCGVGKIRNNSGICVPFAEAGVGANGCGVGKTRNASGVCVVGTGTGGTGTGGTGTGGTGTGGTGTGGTGTGGSGTGSAGTGHCTIGSVGCSSTGTCAAGSSGCTDGVCSANSGTTTNTDPDCATGGGQAGTCDPTKSICEGDGQAAQGDMTAPSKIENTVKLSWWVSKYPSGLTGIWAAHKSDIDNTSFIQSLNQFKQGVPDSGSCPVFPFVFGQYNGSISPPCIIWPFLRLVFLFSTMMLCRRIIFGG